LFAPAVAYNHKKEVFVLTGTSLVEYKEGQFTIFRRDQDYENDFMDFIRSLHPEFAGQNQEEALALPLSEIVDKHWFFDAFEAMKSKNVEVLGLQLLKSFKYSPHRASIRTGISSGVDWFDLSVNVSFGEYEVPLKKLRKHILQDEKFIELGDGSVGILPSEWVEKLKKYFRIGELQGDKLLLSKLRFGLVDELFENIDETAIAQELAEKKARIQSFETITNIKKPAAIKAQLRDYQKAGLNWLGFLDEMKWGGILADDMGLGKTVQILTFLATQKSAKPKTSLVVLPTTLIFNWENEINKFYPTLKVLFYYGSNRDKEVLKSSEYQLVITTYGVMINDIEILKEIKFNYVILDESQAIKNPLSKRYKAACLLQGKNRLTLTGTPIENNTFDLYAQMNFVNPGMLGNQKFFKEQYSNPVDKDQDAGRANELRKLVSPFILRRTKEQVATELPPKTEDVIWCRMESDQFRIYEEYRNKYRMYLLNKIDENGLEKSKMFVLEGLLKLRQICNSPELLKDEDEKTVDSVKLDELMRQINEKTGNHKIVVFSQFVQMLKIIERELKREGHDYEYFDGSSLQKQRRDSVNRFQQDTKCRVFLISLKAGGTGINLTSADYVYIFDPWWNPAVENQAIDRTYRIGQDKKVFAYRMICKDTVEEKILKYQERKKAVAADIIRTEESFIKHLTKEDIGELFG
jgi:SNF2 family DNA or RNA helicase